MSCTGLPLVSKPVALCLCNYCNNVQQSSEVLTTYFSSSKKAILCCSACTVYLTASMLSTS